MLDIISIVTLKNNPDAIAKGKTILQNMAADASNDEGCISFVLFEDNEQPNRHFFVEKWESQELLDAHNNGDVPAKYLPQIEEHVEDTEIILMTQIS